MLPRYTKLERLVVTCSGSVNIARSGWFVGWHALSGPRLYVKIVQHRDKPICALRGDQYFDARILKVRTYIRYQLVQK